ncbi:hypothetical protein [Vallicoccus soli]|uniref:DUF308 domain-containing protein n=1 Tax=Vallicoccus soli TaxID=2339232 RepID=A0A3A3ZL57_9ACTN|nr:hypothetical protein [Vallicoccus soli]RJK96876.1 hypothetical protein D5H78_06370 [Vallicoccus soli]
MAGPAGRGNGLTAAAYVPLADLQPYVADAVLDLLADAGIAAYAAPAGERRTSEIVAPRVRSVLDRVYVDSGSRERARTLLAAAREDLEGGPAGPAGPAAPASPSSPASPPAAPSDDEVWAQLVASYDAPAPAGAGPWPDAEDVAREDVPRGLRWRRADDAAPAGAGGEDADGTGDPDDDWGPRRPEGGEPAPRRDPEEHFVPPPPPPLPRGDAVSRWAWLGLLGTPVFFFLAVLLDLDLEGWMVLLGVAAFVGGFVVLVARMGDGRGDADDGAVV